MVVLSMLYGKKQFQQAITPESSFFEKTRISPMIFVKLSLLCFQKYTWGN